MIPLMCMTQQPREVEIKGKTYMLSPLSLKDVSDMMQWFVDRPLEICKQEIDKHGAIWTDEERKKIVDAATKEYIKRKEVVNGQDIDQELVDQVRRDMNKEISSVDGVARFLWLSVRHEDPKCSVDDVSHLVDLNTLSAIQDILDGLMFAPQPESPDGQGEGEKKTDGESS